MERLDAHVPQCAPLHRLGFLVHQHVATVRPARQHLFELYLVFVGELLQDLTRRGIGDLRDGVTRARIDLQRQYPVDAGQMGIDLCQGGLYGLLTGPRRRPRNSRDRLPTDPPVSGAKASCPGSETKSSMELIAPTAAIEPDSSFILTLHLLKRQTSRRCLMLNTAADHAASALNTSANGTRRRNFRVLEPPPRPI